MNKTQEINDKPESKVYFPKFALKAKYAAYTTLIFFLVANPETYKLIQKFLGHWVQVSNEGGCPTPYGFFIHTALFFIILWSIMLFPRDY